MPAEGLDDRPPAAADSLHPDVAPHVPPLSPADDLVADMSPEVADAYPRNFRAMVLNHVVTRFGWVFKTESTVIPFFVTNLTSNPLLISVGPVLSRLGHFVSPFLFLGIVDRAPVKKHLLMTVTVLSASVWCVLALILWLGRGLPPAVHLTSFYVIYGASWFLFGIQMVVDRVMQGRLIPTRRRGRVFAIASPIGCYSVLVSGPIIAYLMQREGAFPANFAIMFGIVAFFYFVSAAGQAFFREPKDLRASTEVVSLSDTARDGWRLFTGDVNFRRLFIIATMQSLTFYLFSYFVAYARTWSSEIAFHEALGGTLGVALIVQNVVMGTISLGLGFLVDWKGNRVVLRGTSILLSMAPLAMVVVGRFVPLEHRLFAFLGVFALVAGMPVLHRVMDNYLLEISPRDRQTLYIGVFGTGRIVTVAFPVMIGGLAAVLRGPLGDAAAYEAVFLICGALMLSSVYLAWRLHEPRHDKRPAATSTVVDA